MDLKEYIKNFDRMRKDLKQHDIDFLTLQAAKIISEAKPRTPVDTGALRANWNHTDAKRRGYITSILLRNPQFYASFIEYGTSRGIRPYNMLSVPLNSALRNMEKNYLSSLLKFFEEHNID